MTKDAQIEKEEELKKVLRGDTDNRTPLASPKKEAPATDTGRCMGVTAERNMENVCRQVGLTACTCYNQ